MHASRTSIHCATPLVVLKSVFARYDEDEDDELNSDEFEHALKDLGVDDEMEQRALFALADSDNSKTVSFQDFLNLVQSNGFELLLSSRQDYEFVIETYQNFQQYDENGDGEITWDEFYFYLTKHGYSHQQISLFWRFMDQDHKLVISFEGFWKGFKAIKSHQFQQQQLADVSETCTPSKPKLLARAHSRVLDASPSRSHYDQHNVFVYMRSKLKPTQPNTSPFSIRTGRVLDDNENDQAADIHLLDDDDDDDAEIGNPPKSEAEEKQQIPANISIPTVTHMRLPDVMNSPHSPLYALMTSITPNVRQLSLSLVSSPIAALSAHNNMLSPLKELEIPTKSTSCSRASARELCSNYSFTRSPSNYPSPSCSPSDRGSSPSFSNSASNTVRVYAHANAQSLQLDLTHFPSISDYEEDQYVATASEDMMENEQTSKNRKKQKDKGTKLKRKTKGKKELNSKKKRRQKQRTLRECVADSGSVCIDRTPVLRPNSGSAKNRKYRAHRRQTAFT